MELYHSNMSVCAQKVRLVLREKKLTPVEHHLNLRSGDQTRPEYLRLNPNGVVPTLVVDGQPIVESTVICEYLDDSYPDPPLRPRDPMVRAAMRLWAMVPDTSLHSACLVISFAIAFRHQVLALPQEEINRQLAEKPDPTNREYQRQTIVHGIDAPCVADSIRVYDRVLTRMSKQLEVSPWLAGDQYSLADTALLPYVSRLEDLNLSWLWDGNRVSIGRWLNRAKGRANYGGIADYRDEAYVELMKRSGSEAGAKIKAILIQR